MRHEGVLAALLRADARRWHLLALVRDLDLPDAWVGAGFVRTAVWDHLHARPAAEPGGDVDVAWFDPARVDPDVDRGLEVRLHRDASGIDWSVKNQARMHMRNRDPPYTSSADAISRWPETATAVAVRRLGDELEVRAPFGLHDLFGLVVRPTPAFAGARAGIVGERAAAKGWLDRWPLLRSVMPSGEPGTTLRP